MQQDDELDNEQDDLPDLEDVAEGADEGEPHDVPPEEDDVSSEDPLRDHSPRSVAEILGISPPLSRGSEPSEQSAQPDQEPDDPSQDDPEPAQDAQDDGDGHDGRRVVPLRQVGPPLGGPPLGAEQPIPLRYRCDAFVWIAPVSGRSFHIARDCNGLPQADYGWVPSRGCFFWCCLKG